MVGLLLSAIKALHAADNC